MATRKNITDTENHTTPRDTPSDTLTPVIIQRRPHGWTADRQRRFIEMLAVTGCVSSACQEVGLTTQSAYRLRARADAGAFAAAWEAALLVATNRLVALAFERAVHGIPRSVWRDDKLVMETRQPSERLLIFLLTHLMPARFGGLSPLSRKADNRAVRAHALLPERLDALIDVDCPVDGLCGADYLAQKPLDDLE